jgi:D-glycero-D-manno-heptose 1,7-bisphosphate phosphatase
MMAERNGQPTVWLDRAVFLDRDGVVLKVRKAGAIHPPPRSLEQVEIVDDAKRALETLRAAGFMTVVVTNQPDIARGELEERVVRDIHELLRSQLALDVIYYCPHDNDDACDCRKPKPGMILQAAAEWGIELKRSCLIGDRWVDLKAAEAAGIDGILLEAPYSWHPTSAGSPTDVGAPRFVGQTLSECVTFILSSHLYG